MKITSTGHYLPPDVATNEALSRVMDVTPEWIYQRTGIRERHFVGENTGVSDLGAKAAQNALTRVGMSPNQVDYVIMSTMTPDYQFPGPAAMVAAKLGMPTVPCLDVRQQCASFVYQLQLAHALITTKQANNILLIGAEAHAGFMPWQNWDYLYNRGGEAPSQQALQYAALHRGLAILFGDGAGAVLVSQTGDDPLSGGSGLLGVDLHSDGNLAEYLYMPSGFIRRGAGASTEESQTLIPRMKGKELFKQAVTKLPESVRAVCAKCNISLEEIDLFVAHQANDRINSLVRQSLGVPESKVPGNIEKLGNTSAGTIPILLDYLNDENRLQKGMLVCFLALGAGLHWGSAIVRL